MPFPPVDTELATTPIPAHPAPARPGTPPRPARKRRRLVPVLLGGGLGLAIVAGGAGGLYWLSQQSGRTQATEPTADTTVTGRPPPGEQPAEGAVPVLPGTTTVVAAESLPARDTVAVQEEAAPAPVTPPPPTTGRVTVSGLPRGGSVRVDGRRRSGTTFELSAGSHEIRMSAGGYEPVTLTVDVTAGERMTVPYTGRRLPPPEPARPAPAPERPGVLQVLIRPWANVFIDGTAHGSNTRFIDTLAAGSYRLRFEREGYITVDTIITLRPGQELQLRIRMRRGN